MEKLRITTIQSNLHWEAPEANRKMFDQKTEGLAGKTDIVVLPEMFTTGFSMNPSAFAETMDGSSMKWLANLAQRLDAVITGSLIIKDQAQYFNRMIWMPPNGDYQYYDKRHLFTLAKEHEHYTAGQQKLITHWKGWKICLLICYDLRFPVWSRNVEGYDLLIYVANWPNKRNHAWKTLLAARAIENQAYVVGVNRVGTDANDLVYSGDTSVIDPMGEVLYQISNTEELSTNILSLDVVRDLRSKLAFLEDKDHFTIR